MLADPCNPAIGCGVRYGCLAACRQRQRIHIHRDHVPKNDFACTAMSKCGTMLALASAPHPKIKGSSLAAHQAFASLTHKDEFFKSSLGSGLIKTRLPSPQCGASACGEPISKTRARLPRDRGLMLPCLCSSSPHAGDAVAKPRVAGLTKIKLKNTVGIYSTASGEAIAHLNAVDGCLIRCTRWSPDSALVAIGTSVAPPPPPRPGSSTTGQKDGTAFIKFFFIRDLKTGKRGAANPPASGSSEIFSRQASQSRPVHAQNYKGLASGSTFATGHTADIVEIAFGPAPKTKSDEHRIATGGKDNKVKVFFYTLDLDGISNWHQVYECDDALNRVYTISWKPDGQHIVVGSDDHSIRIYDVRDTVRADAPPSSPPETSAGGEACYWRPGCCLPVCCADRNRRGAWACRRVGPFIAGVPARAHAVLCNFCVRSRPRRRPAKPRQRRSARGRRPGR